jgi:hypothetical protein
MDPPLLVEGFRDDSLARMRYVYATGVPGTSRPAFPEAFLEFRWHLHVPGKPVYRLAEWRLWSYVFSAASN